MFHNSMASRIVLEHLELREGIFGSRSLKALGMKYKMGLVLHLVSLGQKCGELTLDSLIQAMQPNWCEDTC